MVKRILCLTIVLIGLAAVHMAFPVLADGMQDITDTGIEFITQPPTEETQYIAGEGTVTYTPAQDGKNAVITMDNATILGSVCVKYQTGDDGTAAILAAGKIDLVLIGENTIRVTNTSAHGMLFLNSNLTVKGTGSLLVDTTAVRITTLAAFVVLNGDGATEEMGTFTQESGTITIKSQLRDTTGYSLYAVRGVTINGGCLTVEGGCASVYTPGDIRIAGGTVSCTDFTDNGLYSIRGDIVISGEDTKVNIATLEKDDLSIAVSAGGEVQIQGGRVSVASGQVGLYTENGGDITISGGYVNVKAENLLDGVAVGVYATGRLHVTGGLLQAAGIGSDDVQGVGLYSETAIAISGADVTVQGDMQAISPAPDISAFADAVITAAADFEGTQGSEYDPALVDSYRYFRIQPPAGQFAIRYQNGQATIEASRATNALVVFAAYDDAGKLNGSEVQILDLEAGTNPVTPHDVSLMQGQHVKIMLWDAIHRMTPLCAAADIPIFG